MERPLIGSLPDADHQDSPKPGRLPLSVLILARDEEANLPDCLHSVTGWTHQVAVLVDPRTTDRTRDVALRSGAEVYEHAFEGFGAQRNWAITSIAWRQPWLLIVDADERVSPQLREEIREAIRSPAPKAAYAMRYQFIFFGKWIKHCWYGTWKVSLFQVGRARYETRRVHEHVIVDGEIGFLRSNLIHNDFKDMDAWIAKHNRYATLEAEEMLRGEQGDRLHGKLFGHPLERRRFLKQAWMRLPFRPLWLFLYLYVFRLGVLDGSLGFRFCLMKAVFDGFTTAKVWEKTRLMKHPPANYYRHAVADYLSKHADARAYYD